MDDILHEPELLIDGAATLAEGPCWHTGRNRLLWVDIEGKRLHLYDPAANRNDTVQFDRQVGAAVPTADGNILLAMRNGMFLYDESSGELRLVADPEAHIPTNRFNDGKCDPAGRFWAGTISMTGEAEAGSLYRLDRKGQVAKMMSGLSISNGLGWSPDYATMYLVDSKIRQVFAFDFDVESGNIANRRTIVEFAPEDGLPDGMAVDENGMLWIAHWDGAKVSCFDPKRSRIVDVIRFPVRKVSSCAFGGARLDELYVTTAKSGPGEPEDRYGGSLFRVKLGVRGMPTFEYRPEV